MPDFQAEVTSTVTVDFEVFCGTCGEGLCSSSKGGQTKRRGTPFVSVDVCSRCMEKEFDRGRNDGYEAGYNDAQVAA